MSITEKVFIATFKTVSIHEVDIFANSEEEAKDIVELYNVTSGIFRINRAIESVELIDFKEI